MDNTYIDVYGYEHTAIKKIGGGGQGVVYSTANNNIALKFEVLRADDKNVIRDEKTLIIYGEVFTIDGKNVTIYKDNNDNEFIMINGELVIKRSPEENKKFDDLRLLPIPSDIAITLPQATLKNVTGYVMTLLDEMKPFESLFACDSTRETDYTNEWLESVKKEVSEKEVSEKKVLEDLIKIWAQYIKSGGRRRRLLAYMKTAETLARLHEIGLVYCDFSDNNAFMSANPESSVVWLIDCDNLDFQSNTSSRPSYFTAGYAAPEILAKKGATFYSDSYSFAISFFKNLTCTYPFYGKAIQNGDFDDAGAAEKAMYSGQYAWILDKEDTSNEEMTSIPRETVMSSALFKCFDNTFSKGRLKKLKRTTMPEWYGVIAKELDRSVKCRYCNMDYDGVEYNKCPLCDTITPVIRFASDNRNIFVHELSDRKFKVPLRILHGARRGETDKKLFSVSSANGNIVISELNEEYRFNVSPDGISYKNAFGEIIFNDKCFIKCRNNLSDKTIVIDVEVIK